MKKFLLLLPLFLFVTQAQAAIVNVALDAPAFANAPIWGNDLVARLTDGRRTPQIHADVTPPTGLAYWVDLGVPRAITEIKIYPRQDNCCAERFSNVRVSVHDPVVLFLRMRCGRSRKAKARREAGFLFCKARVPLRG